MHAQGGGRRDEVGVFLSSLPESHASPELVARLKDILQRPRTPRVDGRSGLLASPLADDLEGMLDAGDLERVVPAYSRIRGLRPPQSVHELTVDKHSIQAVRVAERLAGAVGLHGDPYSAAGSAGLGVSHFIPLANALESVGDLRGLYLGLLLHDLGKGFPPEGGVDDHVEKGVRLAGDCLGRLGLDSQVVGDALLVVGKHHRFNEMVNGGLFNAEGVGRLAAEAGSERGLSLMFLASYADLTSVQPSRGPGGYGFETTMLEAAYDECKRRLGR